jgi:hypothetical protein
VQAPPAVAALLALLSLTRVTSDAMPTPDALRNSSTFVSVRRLCNTAVLYAHAGTCHVGASEDTKASVTAAVAAQPAHPSP